jgi:ribonuclease HI
MDIRKYHNVYIDGSCLKNGNTNAKAGIGIYFGKNDKRNISKKIISKSKVTNNIAELIVMRQILSFVNDLPDKKMIWNIYSDSQYTINCITSWVYKWRKNGWISSSKKQVKNKELINNINILYEKNKDFVRIFHIKAHTNKNDENSIGNKYADLLAVHGSSHSDELNIDNLF